jgi:type II secretory pathway predicted ATPase ExeA
MDLELEEVVRVLNFLLYKGGHKFLSNTEIEVLSATIASKTYNDVTNARVEPETIKNAGSLLFKRISAVLKRKISKSTFNSAFKSFLDDPENANRANTDRSRVDRHPHKLQQRHPFSDRGRIEDPDRLFGREELIRGLQEELSKGSSISLVGDTRVGKSSILRYLYYRGEHEWWGVKSEFIYIDMQLINRDEEFYAALCAELEIEHPCEPLQLDTELRRRNRRYILLIDEIEALNSEKFSSDIRKNLRGWADGDYAPFILVIVSRSHLDIVFPSSTGEPSPLTGFCHHLDVLPFTEAETTAFIQHRLVGTGVNFTDEQIADLYQQTQGHPARLQQAATALYDATIQQKIE